MTAPLTADQLAQMREIPLVGDAPILIDEIDCLTADLAHAQELISELLIERDEQKAMFDKQQADLAHARERIAALEQANFTLMAEVGRRQAEAGEYVTLDDIKRTYGAALAAPVAEKDVT